MFRKAKWLAAAMAAVLVVTACEDDDPVTVTPPTAPTGLSIVEDNGTLVLTWNASADADNYDVERQNVTAATAFSTVASNLTETTYTDSNVVERVRYQYRVVAKNDDGTARSGEEYGELGLEEEVLNGVITGARVLSADTTYILEGIVLVADGGSLTIPAGTLLYGSTDIQPTALIVQQGGQIFSNGTETDPVVFTSPAANPSKGDWGGVVVNGYSICNFPADDCVGEGLAGPYGGDDEDDDSGVIQYTRIEWAGFEVSFGNELNALTLNGVGSGTELHHVQTHGGLDDGFEWFGGTVDAKYLIATDISDDSFDYSTGWAGRGQFWIAQQDPDDADNGYEVDGNEDDYDAMPLTSPDIYNVTLVGKGENGQGGTAGESTRGMLLRRGTGGVVANHIVIGFGGDGLDIDNAETVGRLEVRNSLIFSNNTDLSADDDGIDETALFNTPDWANRLADPELADPFDRDDPDFRPASGSAATNGFLAVPNDGWFDGVDYIGAVGPGATEWYKAAWTRWGS